MKRLIAPGQLLAVLLIVMAVFIIGPGIGYGKDKASIECYKETARTVVHATAVGLGVILKGVKSEKERVDMIRSFVGPIRFYADESGYFYVYDYSCRNDEALQLYDFFPVFGL